MQKMAEIFTEELYMPNGRKLSMLKNLDHINAIFGSYQGHVLEIYTISIFLEEWNGSNFSVLPCEPTGDYIKYQIIRTLAGPCSGYIVAKLSGHAKAIFGPFNYSYTIRTCKTIVNGYCGIVW